MSRAAIACVLTLLWAGWSCGKVDPAVVTAGDQQDPELAAAFDRAADTLDRFSAALATRASNQERFAVKGSFSASRVVEHIWVNEVAAKGDDFIGKLANAPRGIPDVRKGQYVEVPRGRVVDWMYVEDGVLVGGYTIRILRQRMSYSARKDFDARLKFEIPEEPDPAP